ncbi:MAG: response regulator [Chlorobium sp.]|uniref:response regulator transcription factor n=1 Tax=Chlorobium sp. TaxID=1095 RepID=UPI0025C457B3|nr:response regulator [Chlorobium sp.]MCF8215509.1 response regulator [Chlorobium sp.]MCF8270437.1 response regulator [Chlorobium sp.]MCF8286807.1 response regulator [Chlorobium sp.]MCF8290329.1 response regulator [Chlorobium sp.]MCF8384488.1 response regulator [Chlorobium sp.]
MNVLVIEDDADVRNMIRMILADEGYSVEDACNGLEGMKKLNHGPFDLIVTDMLMPEKEGIETIREIKKQSPSTKIVAISGGGICIPENYLNLALMMGADASLCKPFGRQELLDTIRKL